MYSDVDVAVPNGYVDRTAQNNPNNPVRHYMNGARAGVAGDKLDAEHPSGLIYWVGEDGSESVLLGVVYTTRDATPPQPGGPLTVWHHHSRSGCPPAHPDCPAASGAPAGRNVPKMLHVWFFKGVADRFAHDFMGALPPGHQRGEPMPREQ